MEIKLSGIRVGMGQPGKDLFAIPCLNLEAGSRVFIEGPSGFGKTTLLHLIAGLTRPNAGHIHIGASDFGSMSDNALSAFRRQHIGIVFQKLNLLDHLTAAENVLLTLPKAKGNSARVQAALEEVNVAHLSERRTAALSLGEQQRIAVARVIAQRPQIVLADEPTSSLDEANADAVIKALHRVSKDSTLVVVSHDQRLRSRFKTIFDFRQWVV